MDLPANVNDSDLTPEMKEPPQPRKDWTRTTFLLIHIGLGKAMQKITDMAASSSPSSPPSEEARKRIIQEMTATAEESLANCNPIIPQQRLTLSCTRFLIRKTDFVSRIQWVLLQKRAGLYPDFANEENLVEALDILEPRMFIDDEMLQQFSWAFKAYPQYHILMYVLLHLCVRPEGPRVDRAWRVVNTFFAEEVPDGMALGMGSKISVLSALRTKALSTRKQSQRKLAESSAGNDDHVPDSAPQQSSATSPTLMDETNLPGLDVDMISEWPEWADIVHRFQLDDSSGFWQ